MKTHTLLFVLLFSLILSGLSGCGQQEATTPPLQPVTVQLKWVHQGQFAGFYVAEEKGFYTDENLDVTLAPGGIGIDIVDEVLSGRADFGLIGAEYVILNRSAGKPVRAIATTYRNNPFVLVTLPDSGIESPADFPGHSANVAGIDGLVQFIAMLNKLNLDSSEIEITPYSYDLEDFYSGEVDITPAFSAGSLIQILENHPDVNVIWPLDYGIHFYSDTLFATDQTITDDSDLVLRFLRATLRGHQYALENLEEATQITLLYADNPDPVVQKEMIDASLPLIYTGTDEIGWMRPEVWQGMYEILARQDLLEGSVNLEDAFTNQFLEEIYGGAP